MNDDPNIIERITRAQRTLNDHRLDYMRWAAFYGLESRPLTRWQRAKRKVSQRWSDARCRVALWIAPELDEY